MNLLAKNYVCFPPPPYSRILVPKPLIFCFSFFLPGAKGHGQIIKAHITLVPKGEVITLFLMII